ncbi:Phosphoribosylformimino-5-aminoimidazole carboxamide ribotide isomerase [Serinicoccus hydrothermalis]|uniref:Phosphoribosylformimino-5-aminoimidazole carboxamide ribotide isomerase n=1 Tax=Serinicoccus hydrothermalis TaxID=1758689 RepID=A0A1B1N7Y1_9MICO|nr:HisA/HisF-related TIM barrel protein [Serinicoccus hydrothermalis]ANS77537.1 Phosphoribosylformimino-5-aminoimidazole carboxamide ribotide isomerase [Serinicoccus hydrothermalis]
MTGTLTLLPAVDVAGGRAAQARDGAPDDPLRIATDLVDQGAAMLHLVDLDRAFGRGGDPDLMTELLGRIPVPVQLSGGIATTADVAWAAGTGASRVVLASSALSEPALVEAAAATLGERLVVAVDVREGQVVARGTPLVLGPTAEVLAGHPALRDGRIRVLVADASRDGRRSGADLDLFASVAELVGSPVTASGGVADLADLTRLRASEAVDELVLGAALHEGAFTLRDALEVCA